MEPILGQIALFPYTYTTFTPLRWLRCEGQELSISQNTALFALLGPQFGGDGVTTFALPDMRGKEPIPNTHYYIAVEGIFPMGGK